MFLVLVKNTNQQINTSTNQQLSIITIFAKKLEQ